MTDLEIIIETARLDDPRPRWEIHSEYCNGKETQYVGYRYPAHAGWIFAKDYLASRDAIVPVIVNVYNGKGEDCIQAFEDLLLLEQGIRASGIKLMRGLYATPRQLCVALLKAVGKWREQ